MALWAGVGIAALGLAYQGVSGEQQAKTQRRARRNQKQQQEVAESAAASQLREQRASLADQAAQGPDPTAILSQEQQRASRRARRTSLSGGVSSDKLRLSRNALLGE